MKPTLTLHSNCHLIGLTMTYLCRGLFWLLTYFIKKNGYKIIFVHPIGIVQGAQTSPAVFLMWNGAACVLSAMSSPFPWLPSATLQQVKTFAEYHLQMLKCGKGRELILKVPHCSTHFTSCLFMRLNTHEARHSTPVTAWTQ